ncbi:MAG TPA: CRISPR-associated endonuclease Cas1 [Acholeplasmataceae bacterium]|nr:CRISPR-associated endonuclease Cas1 [Acholeplasmataceae bacterium]
MRKRIYLYSNGELIRKDNNLCFKTKESINYLPIHQIETINAFSHINLNKNTIILLHRNNIIINFFDYHGNYSGSYYPYIPIQGKYIEKQVLFLNQNQNRLFLAKELVTTAMVNMLSVIKYYIKKKRNLKEQQLKLENMLYAFRNSDVDSVEEIMLYEAKFKGVYYSCFSNIVFYDYFKFTKRSIRPPKDPINALMSYGYTQLYTLISNIIHRSRLHISLPIIHGNVRSPEGLQYDIADIFKPIIIDRLIFRLINKKQIQAEDFDIKEDKVYLNRLGINVFINNFEELLYKTIYINEMKRKLSYRNIISREVHKISNHIFNNQKYKGFRSKW